MATVQSIAAFLEQLAPARLAEEWDNVGLLVGRRDAERREADDLPDRHAGHGGRGDRGRRRN